MLMGYNNDVPYKGVVVHVQTEDHGLPDARITTQVFFSGAILDSRTVSYEKEIDGITDEGERDQKIRRFMQALHKSFFKKIQAATYDERLPIRETGTVEAPLTPAEPAVPRPPMAVARVSAADRPSGTVTTSSREAHQGGLQFASVPAWRGIDEPEPTALAELLSA